MVTTPPPRKALTLAQAKRQLLRQAADAIVLKRALKGALAGKDAAYRDRNALLAWFAAVHRSHLVPAARTDGAWQQVLCVHTEVGQLAWHLPDAELAGFPHVPKEDANDWDGHTTTERYQRIEKLVALAKQ